MLCFHRHLWGGVYPSIHWGRHPLGRHLPGRHPPPSACWDTHTPAQCIHTIHSLPSACWDTHTLPSACWDTHPLPSACWDTHPCPVHAGIHTRGHCSGHYASYWNAFFFTPCCSLRRCHGNGLVNSQFVSMPLNGLFIFHSTMFFNFYSTRYLSVYISGTSVIIFTIVINVS